tara:strand:+ start:4569 stop:4997 length:429 start_codon:yes stop_codon:yes gene_type:complete
MKKTKMEENFEEIFDLPSNDDVEGELVIDTPKKPLSPEGSDDVDTDYQYARENLYNVIERGSDALNTLVEIANQSESPRAFEIVSTLIKTLSDANKDLLEVQTKVKKLKEETATGPKNVTNALFIGNTSDLQKLIRDRKTDV